MRILVADDDAVARRLLETLLHKWGYDVTAVGNGAEALAALRADEPPPLAVLDWMMPEVDGIEVCRKVRKRTGEPYIYIFLLTAKSGRNDIIQGLEAGADDYLTKPFDQAELQVRLRTATRLLDLQDALIAARERLREQATHDSLTGLWNRSVIMEELSHELARAERHKTATTVIMADLDHFKLINDVYGHLGGDEVLRQMAQRMRASARQYDSVGRYGGEEFLIIAPQCHTDGARRLAEAVRRKIVETPVAFGDRPIDVTISLGAAVVPAGHWDTGFVVHIADDALYRAKNKGRNRAEHVIARHEESVEREHSK